MTLNTLWYIYLAPALSPYLLASPAAPTITLFTLALILTKHTTFLYSIHRRACPASSLIYYPLLIFRQHGW